MIHLLPLESTDHNCGPIKAFIFTLIVRGLSDVLFWWKYGRTKRDVVIIYRLRDGWTNVGELWAVVFGADVMSIKLAEMKKKDYPVVRCACEPLEPVKQMPFICVCVWGDVCAPQGNQPSCDYLQKHIKKICLAFVRCLFTSDDSLCLYSITPYDKLNCNIF